jgi:hypothetical protein
MELGPQARLPSLFSSAELAHQFLFNLIYGNFFLFLWLSVPAE